MKLSKKTVLIAVAILGVVGFFMMFIDPIKMSMMGMSVKAPWDQAWFGKDGADAIWPCTIAWFLLLLSSLAIAAVVFKIKDESLAKKIKLASAVAMLVAGVVLALTLIMFAMVYDYPSDMWGDLLEAADLTAGPIIGSICGLAGGVLTLVAEKKLQ
jgi:hypothetical protein